MPEMKTNKKQKQSEIENRSFSPTFSFHVTVGGRSAAGSYLSS